METTTRRGKGAYLCERRRATRRERETACQRSDARQTEEWRGVAQVIRKAGCHSRLQKGEKRKKEKVQKARGSPCQPPCAAIPLFPGALERPSASPKPTPPNARSPRRRKDRRGDKEAARPHHQSTMPPNHHPLPTPPFPPFARCSYAARHGSSPPERIQHLTGQFGITYVDRRTEPQRHIGCRSGLTSQASFAPKRKCRPLVSTRATGTRYERDRGRQAQRRKRDDS